jgi:hypothetical protein
MATRNKRHRFMVTPPTTSKEIAENSNMTQWPFFKGGKGEKR